MARFGMMAGLFLLGMSLPQLASLLHRAGALGGFLYWGTLATVVLALTMAIAFPAAFAGLFGTSPVVFKKSAMLLAFAGAVGLMWGWF